MPTMFSFARTWSIAALGEDSVIMAKHKKKGKAKAKAVDLVRRPKQCACGCLGNPKGTNTQKIHHRQMTF
jgi:hypothetical protein